jgi:trimeric autotransporter adhesin
MTILHSTPARRALAVLAIAAIAACATASSALAAITLSGTPDPTYQTDGVPVGSNFAAHAILRADGVVYVAGAFTAVLPSGFTPGTGETTRNNLAAFDAHTGALLPWDPNANGTVRSLAIGPSGNTIFAGGDFTTVDGVSHQHIVAIPSARNNNAGVPLAWNGRTNGSVYAIAVAGVRVYLGGAFTNVDGVAHKNVASVGLSHGGQILPWVSGTDGEVRALLLSPNGSRVFMGGLFHLVNQVSESHLAAVDAITGRTLPWASHPAYSILSLAETSSYLYGAGTGGGGHLPSYALVAQGGLGTGGLRWTASFDGDVVGVSMYHGDVIAAGHFNSFGSVSPGQTRHHMAALNAVSGLLDTWAPVVNQVLGPFTELAYGQQVYVGGDFTKVAGVDQQGFTQFSDSAVDTTPPTITTAPDVRMVAGTAITSYVPVTLSWAGSDDLSGICRYNVQEKIDSGAFAAAVPPFSTATSMSRLEAPNHTYSFQALATDCSDNAGVGYTTGPTSRITLTQNSSSAITYSGSWVRNARVSGASGGTLSYTTHAGASATLHFTGRQIAWVASKSSGRGKASVYIDGSRVAIVDLHAAGVLRRQVVYAHAFAGIGAHTIRIVCLGTPGRAIVDIDALLTLR